jgi:hypothetical protein
MLTYVSVLILVGTEVYGIALAAAWAVGGLFELGDTITNVLYAAAAVLATYSMYVFGRKAYGVDASLEGKERSARSKDTSLPPEGF